MKQHKYWIILLTLLLTLLIGAGSAAAQQIGLPPNTITVSGEGSAMGTPDVAYVRLGVQTSGSDITTAFADANATVEGLINALAEAGVARVDMQTSGLYIFQDALYDPQTGMPGEPIFRVGNSLQITIREVERVGELISLAVSNGANSIDSLQFGIADTTALEDEARLDAIADARERAQKLAEAMGVTLGTPLIVEEYAPSSIGIPIGGGRGGMAMADIAPIEGGQLSVTVNVRVTFRLFN